MFAPLTGREKPSGAANCWAGAPDAEPGTGMFVGGCGKATGPGKYGPADAPGPTGAPGIGDDGLDRGYAPGGAPPPKGVVERPMFVLGGRGIGGDV